MEIAFLTNVITPHQISIYNEFNNYENIKFYFIECMNIDKSALPIGWQYRNDTLDNLVTYEQFKGDYKKYCDLIEKSDVVIIGSAPDSLIENRLKQNKLTFKYAERFYKTGLNFKNYFRNMLAAWLHHGRFQKYPLYMLCASAYTAADCAKFGNYKDRCYEWGYFPELKKYDDINDLFKSKKENSLLWAGRLIDFKHPEIPLLIAKRLREEGYTFKLNIIGVGELEEKIRNQITNEDLEDCVSMLGQMPTEKVREYMEQSEIFLFTSDRREGWGSVLNEAMNSGCAVVASQAIGSVPFLIKDNENGLVYRDSDIEVIFNKVKYLLDNPKIKAEIGINAYETINNEWNANVAADRFVKLVQTIESGSKRTNIFESGPCSKAEILSE